MGVFIGIVFAIIIWFIVELADGPDDVIRSDKQLSPEIELVIKDNRVDTIYVYRKP